MRLVSRREICAWGGLWLAAVLLAAAQPGWAASRSRDLVVVGHERWLDTLKGTVKNFSKQSAREVTIIVKFYAKKNKTPLGTQRVSVGDLRSGEQADWSLAIAEKNRPAGRYDFEMHAIWQ